MCRLYLRVLGANNHPWEHTFSVLSITTIYVVDITRYVHGRDRLRINPDSSTLIRLEVTTIATNHKSFQSNDRFTHPPLINV